MIVVIKNFSIGVLDSFMSKNTQTVIHSGHRKLIFCNGDSSHTGISLNMIHLSSPYDAYV